MFGKKKKQNFRIIAVLEELNDVSTMLKDYFDEYGYKSGIVTKIEVNNPNDITILQIDPNHLIDLKDYKIESMVINLKSPLIYQKEILTLCKKIEKTGSIVADKKALDKLEKKIKKDTLIAKIDYSTQDETRTNGSYKNVAFYAESITKSLYKYSDKDDSADKMWKINNKYAYRLEALLFATVNSCGLIS
ncbi:MAG: hypothetical protein WCJ19_01990 [bacterium]